MFGFLRDIFQGMPCPACHERGLVGVGNRAVQEGLEEDLLVNPRYMVARCRRCDGRFILDRLVDKTYRPATDEEWQAQAYEELPSARVR